VKMVAACFGPAVRVIQTVVVDHVTREEQGTNEDANMLASRQHIKLLFRDGQKSVYCAFKGGVTCAEACEPVSKGQICIWARMCQVLPLGGLHH
jgi:hypothetical protein